VLNGYLLMLGSLILIGGSLGDIYGERLIFEIGVSAFAWPRSCAPWRRASGCRGRAGAAGVAGALSSRPRRWR